MAKKTTCPITRDQFWAKARPVKVVIEGKEQEADVKEFSSGSLGWYLNSKISLQIDGVSVPVQIGMNLTIVGSKELPREEGAGGPRAHEAPATGAAEPTQEEGPTG
jgi:hypothetical protein